MKVSISLSLEGAGFIYLGGLVLGGSDEVRPVLRPLEIDHGHVKLVNGEVEELVSGLGIVLGDGPILVTSNNVLAEVAPPSNRSLALVANNSQGLLVALFGLGIELDVEHDNGAQVAHSLLCHAQELGSILVELHTLDRSWELPRLQQLASLDFPEADCVVGRPGGEEGCRRVDINGPDSADVAVVCA